MEGIVFDEKREEKKKKSREKREQSSVDVGKIATHCQLGEKRTWLSRGKHVFDDKRAEKRGNRTGILEGNTKRVAPGWGKKRRDKSLKYCATYLVTWGGIVLKRDVSKGTKVGHHGHKEGRRKKEKESLLKVAQKHLLVTKRRIRKNKKNKEVRKPQ